MLEIDRDLGLNVLTGNDIIMQNNSQWSQTLLTDMTVFEIESVFPAGTELSWGQGSFTVNY